MIRAYYILTKPGIIRGNALTTAAGFFLASGGKGDIDWSLLLAILVGSSLVVASGCVFNNYIDRSIDSKMARTKQRALVSGSISARSAVAYAALLGVAGAVVLALFTNFITVGIGLFGLFVYVVLYGIIKRRSVHGTLVGSLAGAVPPVAGYTAVTGSLDTAALLLFLILITWQMPHFYAIAMYRFDDYAAAKLPVLPVKHGMAAAKQQILLYILAFLASASALTLFGYTGYGYLIVMIGLCAGWLWLGLKGLGLVDGVVDDKRWARKMFFASLLVITSWCVAVSADSLLTLG